VDFEHFGPDHGLVSFHVLLACQSEIAKLVFRNLGTDLTQSDDNVCLALMEFRFHFSFDNSPRSNFRVRADLVLNDLPNVK
jgi:hypothetical protein